MLVNLCMYLYMQQAGVQTCMCPPPSTGYSFGVRQTFVRMYSHYPGFKVINTGAPPEDYNKAMHESVYCLAPAGWGWGARFKTSVTHGCIPVVVQVQSPSLLSCFNVRYALGLRFSCGFEAWCHWAGPAGLPLGSCMVCGTRRACSWIRKLSCSTGTLLFVP